MTDSIAERDERRTRVALDLFHHLLLVLTVALRPVIFGGDLAAPDQLVWHGLVLAGWALLLVEWWSGRRGVLRWSAGGLIGVALLAVLLPAAARAAEPALGWGRWVSWASLLLWAGYLLQVLPGRGRFTWSLLAGALAVQATLALVQAGYVLPAMERAMHRGDDAIAELVARVGDADVGQRIERGGTYGTFTLANILAAWLVVVAVPIAGAGARGIAAWRRGDEHRPPSHTLVIGCLLLVLGLGALLSTGARGAPAALIAAGAVVAMRWWRGPARFAPVTALTVAGAVALAVPALHALVQGSIDVRLGYWRSAGLALAEHWMLGAGIGGFEATAPAYLRLGDEYSRYAHNEVIEAALAGGAVAAIALGAWLCRLCWRRPVAPTVEDPTPSAAYAPWLRWAPALAFPYMLLFGTLASDNLAWWPGGDGPAIAALAAGLGLLFGWIATATARLPAPPPWALQLALGASAIACLLDFQLHDLSFAGSLVLVACLAASPDARERSLAVPGKVALGALVLAAAGVLVMGSLRAAELRRSDAIGSLIDGYYRSAAAGDGDDSWAYLHDLALEAGLPPPPPGQLPPPQEQGVIIRAAWQVAMDAQHGWPASPRRRVDLASRNPAPGERLFLLDAAIGEDAGHRPEAWALLARAYLAERGWTMAVESARGAVARYPAQLRYRALLADALEAAADHRAGDPQVLRAEAAALRAEIAELNPAAHPRHRVPATPPAPPNGGTSSGPPEP